MNNTGRIQKPTALLARRIVFGRESDEAVAEQLRYMTRIDQAHLVMLSECGIIPRDRTAHLLQAIERLRAEDFGPLCHKPATRGLFLLYEDYLIETQGLETGGMLQTARSRNDINATLLKLRLRSPYLRLIQEGLRLNAILLRRAKRYAGVTMPIHTHGQAAMPITYGHYLAGIAAASLRDFDGLLLASADMRSCPLGAGAVAGTSFPISTARTAELLGFDCGPLNSIDAVASRDLLLRVLAAASICAVTLSRLATDLLQWTTAEFDFLHLPDELVGSSSAMPQKRNPFLLEHVQGRSAALLGAFVHASNSTHAVPFTNSIAAGAEAVRPAWGAIQDLADILVLVRLVVAAAKPNTETMLLRAKSGLTVATAFADRLVARGGASFRKAHRLIGTAVLEALARGVDFQVVAASIAREHDICVSFDDLDPSSVVRSLEFGGGPGPSSLKSSLEHLQQRWASQYRQMTSQKRAWREADLRLDRTLQSFKCTCCVGV